MMAKRATMAWTKMIIIGLPREILVILRHLDQPNGRRQNTMMAKRAIGNPATQRQRSRAHPRKHGRNRRIRSQHGKRMIMNLTKRRLFLIFIIHMIFDREESSKRNWRNESNLTCKNWLHSMHWNWKLFLMNNKIWMT